MPFGEKVSIFEGPEPFIPTEVMVVLAENGYKLRYAGKDFIAEDTEEMLGMIKRWMKDAIKEKELKVK